ncbi:Vomp family autotransporter [Bartonella sp. PS7NMGDW]|uniref:Vomp family autotransporter n=1 Tax=Bartonella sp. PS7NMGDW TaxID=3243574 RepID=UPI0035CF4DC4
MKKKYSTPNLIKAVSLSAAMATLLSSVSPVFAANFAFVGGNNNSTSGTSVSYAHGSHGSVVLAGDDDFCGADSVIGRGGKQQQGISDNRRITAQEQYERFIGEKVFSGRQPYGTTTEKVTWTGDGTLSDPTKGYMGTNTFGVGNAMPEAYGVYSFATGCGSAATGNYSTVFGAGATAKAGGAQAFGVSALASGIASVAMGVGSEASGKSTVAIGGLATASGSNSIALGTKVEAKQNYSIAIGTDAKALGSGSIAIGGRRSDRTEGVDPNRIVTAKAENSIAIGTQAYAETEDSVAIGVNSQVLSKDGVAVGGGAISDRDKGVAGYDPVTGVGTTKTDMAWKSTTGAFSVGEVGGRGNGTLTRQITGVAAGSEDTDAVNVAQLKAMRDVIAGGGGWKLSANDTNPTDVNSGNTVDFSVNNSEEGKDNLTIVKNTEDTKHKIQFTLSDTLTLTKVTTGQSSMSDDGFIIQNGPMMGIDGIDAGNQVITNVAEAEDDTDAVNFKQLKEFTAGIKEGGWKLSVEGQDATDVKAGSTVDLIADENEDGSKNIKITKNKDNKVTFDLADDIQVMTVTAGDSIMDADGFRFDGDEGPSITVNGIHAGDKTIKGVAAGEDDTDAVNFAQLTEVKTLAEKGWKLSVDGNNATDVKAGSTVDLVAAASGDGSKNIKIEKDNNNKVTFSLNDALKLTSVTTGNSIMNSDGFKFIDGNGPSMSQNGIDAGDKKITGVAKAEDDTDAVNFAQLKEIKDEIADNGLVQWDEKEKIITIGKEKGGTKIDIAGNEGERTIAGVKNGKISEESTDAINGSQLYAMGDTIANYFGGGASYEDGEWIEPTFKISQREANGTITQKEHHNVADAFEGVDNSITDIYNQINNVTENSLVKQEGEDGLITVGKATGGTEISLVNKDNQERTLSGVKDGELSQTSTQAVNGSQLFKTNANVTTVTNDLKTVAQNTSKYFGGSTDVLNGVEPSFLIQDTKYNNVFDAFTAVNTSITNIDNKISDVVKNSLVKQDGVSASITIGKDTAGTEINIAGYGKVARSISGVKAAEKGDEAVNKDQLDKSIKDITKDIETASAAAVLYDKNGDDSVNYGSVTLGGNKSNGPVALLNVKDGSLSQDSHDAINGSQINKISAEIAKFFGGGAKFIDGAFKGLKYTLSAIVDGKVGQANFYDVGSALTGLDNNVQDVNKRLTNVSNEFNQKIEDFSKDALLWDDGEEAFVARHEKDGQKTKSKLKYLLDGEIAKNSTDAITGNQLYSMSNQLANYFGGGAKYENGKWTDPTFKIVQVNADGTTVEKEHHNVADAFGDINNGMSNINNRIDDVINKVDTDALKWNDKEKAYDAGRNGKPNKIINVADGKIVEGSKDAVNGGQLWKTNERVTGVEKDVKHLTNRVDNISTTVTDIGETVFNIENKVNDIAEDAVRYDRDENGKKTNKITLAGGDASEPVLIDNVADGKIEKGSKEAVNGGQLHDYTKEQMKIILDQSKHYTDQRVNNIVVDAIDDAVDRANQYTDMKFNVLNYSIENVKKEARQAAAIGLAVSNLRYNDTPGKLSVGFGTGLWRSQSAFAFGAGYTSENGKYRSNISATTSGGHWGVGAGFNMTLN